MAGHHSGHREGLPATDTHSTVPCTQAGENELTEVPGADEIATHVMLQARNCILYAKKGTISS